MDCDVGTCSCQHGLLDLTEKTQLVQPERPLLHRADVEHAQLGGAVVTEHGRGNVDDLVDVGEVADDKAQDVVDSDAVGVVERAGEATDRVGDVDVAVDRDDEPNCKVRIIRSEICCKKCKWKWYARPTIRWIHWNITSN